MVVAAPVNVGSAVDLGPVIAAAAAVPPPPARATSFEDLAINRHVLDTSETAAAPPPPPAARATSAEEIEHRRSIIGADDVEGVDDEEAFV